MIRARKKILVLMRRQKVSSLENTCYQDYCIAIHELVSMMARYRQFNVLITGLDTWVKG